MIIMLDPKLQIILVSKYVTFQCDCSCPKLGDISCEYLENVTIIHADQRLSGMFHGISTNTHTEWLHTHDKFMRDQVRGSIVVFRLWRGVFSAWMIVRKYCNTAVTV
jgi:hypothetical protein